MTCITPDCTNLVENKDTGLCASCGHAARKKERMEAKEVKKKSIRTVSKKQAKYNARYNKLKDKWLPGRLCKVEGCYKAADDVHHMKGRSINEFLDEMAEQHDIPLLLDQRNWLPVCRGCHTKITDNSAWAIKEGYSLKRI